MIYLGNTSFIDRGSEVRVLPYIYVVSTSGQPPINKHVVTVPEPVDFNVYEFDGLGYRPTRARAYKVLIDHPGNVEHVRRAYMERGYKTSQSYISYTLRATVDRYYNDSVLTPEGVKAVIESALSRRVRIMALDVEVINGKPRYGYTLDGKTFTTTDVLGDAVAAASEADIVATYNGWSFDAKWLGNYVINNLAIDTPGGVKPIIDLYVLASGKFRSSLGLSETASSLVDVAIQLGIHNELGVQPSRLLSIKKLRDVLDKATGREVDMYLSKDVALTYMIAVKWVPILNVLASIIGTSIHAINVTAGKFSPGHLVEIMIHKHLEGRGILLVDRTREFDYDAGDKTRAGKPGVYNTVAEYDFSAMYPSTMVQYSVDPIGIRECSDGFTVRLRSGPNVVSKRVCFDGGEVQYVLAALYNTRRVTKALKGQYGEAPDIAAKILANSGYGIFGKSGLGIINEWVASFIAQFTQSIFDDLWVRYGPIYGDTDSIYVKVNSQDEAVRRLEEINDYLHGRYGELMEMKLENIWKHIIILRGDDGGPLEKNYVKVGFDGNVVIKGAALKPHDLPRGLRFGPYREWVLRIVEDGARIDDLAREFVDRASLEDLFIEKTMTFEEFMIKKSDDEPINKIDHHRAPLAAALAYRYGNVLIDPRNMMVNGVVVDKGDFINVYYLPLGTRGKYKKYIILDGDGPHIVTVSINGLYVRLLRGPQVGEDLVRKTAFRVVTCHRLFQGLSRVVKQ